MSVKLPNRGFQFFEKRQFYHGNMLHIKFKNDQSCNCNGKLIRKKIKTCNCNALGLKSVGVILILLVFTWDSMGFDWFSQGFSLWFCPGFYCGLPWDFPWFPQGFPLISSRIFPIVLPRDFLRLPYHGGPPVAYVPKGHLSCCFELQRRVVVSHSYEKGQILTRRAQESPSLMQIKRCEGSGLMQISR